MNRSTVVTPIVALDFASRDAALAMVDLLGDRCDYFKVGSELFTVAGPPIVTELIARGKRVFLDLKFHDIPNTVEHAAAAAAALGASILTVHASGGERMVRAGVLGAASAGAGCEVFAVTVLTSLSMVERAAIMGLDAGTPGGLGGLGGPMSLGSGGVGESSLAADVLRLAGIAERADATGIVCSGHEAPAIRERFGDRLKLLVPGVRLPGSAAGDQSRVVTPAAAARAGASYVILGRTVTGSADPAGAMDEAVASLG